jgi:hypothetical protein
MDVNDLKKPKVYYVEDGNFAIFRFECHNEDDASRPYYRNILNTMTYDHSLKFRQQVSTIYILNRNLREATADEIEWLELCEKEGKTIDKAEYPKCLIYKYKYPK